MTIPTSAEGLGEASADEKAARFVPQNYVPPSTAAAHRYGVLYQGEFETPSDGTAQAVRLHARALAATGIPLLLRSFSGMVVTEHGVAEPVFSSGLPKEVEAEVGHLLTTDIAEFRPSIKHVVVRSPEHLRQIILPRYELPGNMEQQLALRDVIYGNSIIYSVWERDRIDPGIARHLARVKQCWVPCRQNAQLLTDSGVPADRVHVVPHPYTDDDQIHLLTRRPPNKHDGWRRFYSIGRWEPRKGFDALIKAFLNAFTPEDKVSLTIKYSGSGHWPGYLPPEQSLQLSALAASASNGWTLAKAAERVKLIDGRVARSQIVGLHLENNIYVSASHGEAFCAVPGTAVDTQHGPVAIEDVQVGDLVHTHRGRDSAVSEALKREYCGDVIAIKVAGLGSELTFTPNHPHYIAVRHKKLLKQEMPRPTFVCASEAKKGDLWAVPRLRPLPVINKIRVSSLVKVAVKTGKITCSKSFPLSEQESLTSIASRFGCSFQFVGKVLSGAARESTLARAIAGYATEQGISQREPTVIPDLIQLTPETMFFFGHYIAEGHMELSTVALSTHTNDQWGRRLSSLGVQQAFGLPTTEQVRVGKKVTVLKFRNAVVGKFMRTLCGGNAKNKYVHATLKASPHVAELIRGLFYGDGSAHQGRYRFSTASPRLASDIVEICNRLGIFVSKRRAVRKKGSCYELVVSAEHTRKFAQLVKPWKYGRSTPPAPMTRGHKYLLEDEQNFYLPIKRVAKRKFSGTVHNLTVSGDESYTCHGYATHNCLPAFDAKLAGNRLVYVAWGGVCDFAADEDIAVPCELEPVHGSYHWEHKARWAGYQLSDLVQGLQRARLPDSFARLPGFEEKFSLRAVGEKMRILVDAATPRISSLPPE